MGLYAWLNDNAGQIIAAALVCTFGACALTAAHFKIKGTWRWPVWVYALQVYFLKMKYYYRMRKMGTIAKDDKFSDMLRQRNQKFIELAVKDAFITRQDANSWYARLSRSWPELKDCIIYSQDPVAVIPPAPFNVDNLPGAGHGITLKPGGGAIPAVKRKKRVIVP